MATGDRFPESWPDALEEFISTYVSPNFKPFIQSSTAVRVAHGDTDDQVGIAIDGKWRFNNLDLVGAGYVEALVPGTPAAGNLVLWVWATANVFAEPPAAEDQTDYSFKLQITTGAAPSHPLVRKVADLSWNGSALTAIRVAFPQPSGVGGFFVSASASAVALQVWGVTSQSAALQTWQQSDGTLVTSVTAAGDLVENKNLLLASASVLRWASDTSAQITRPGAGVLKAAGELQSSGDLVARQGAATEVDVGAVGPGGEAAVAIGADTVLYRSAANVITTPDGLTLGAALRHQGTLLGFYNKTAVTQPSAYTNNTSLSASKTLNTAFTANDLAKVVLALLGDLNQSTNGLGLINGTV